MTEAQFKTLVPSSAPQGSGGISPTPQLVLEVIEGPMDGLVYGIPGDAAQGTTEVRIGRATDNAFSLHGDMLVSSHHARLRPTQNSAVWLLEDLNSANGTWLEGVQVKSPHPLHLGSAFLVGLSVIRCQPPENVGSYLPGIDKLARERRRLTELLAPDMRQALGAATMLACRERRGFVNDRHLFLGVAMNCPELPPFARGKGPIPFDTLNNLLWSNPLWTEIEGWLEERVQEMPISNFFSNELPLAPRVVQSFTQAENEARNRGRKSITAKDWLRIVFGNPTERSHQALKRLGFDPLQLLQSLGQGSMRPAPPPATSVSTGAMKELSIEDTGPNALDPGTDIRSLSSGDPTIDYEAQELARRLYGLAALYHLATPEDRRTALQQLLRQELADWPAERQHRLLNQLRSLFPLDPGSTRDAAEVENLRNQIEQLKHRVTELEATTKGPATSSGLPWHLIVESAGRAEIDALSPVERPRIQFLRELYQFGMRIEQVVAGLVQNFTVQTSNTTSLALPGHRMSLRAYVDDIRAGRPVEIEKLYLYLADVESWLVAGLAAYHEGPEAWFKKYWKRTSPTAIEERVQAGWAKKLGLQYVELWKDYKEVVRKINPEFVTQSIQHEVRRIAQERQRKYSQRRIPR